MGRGTSKAGGRATKPSNLETIVKNRPLADTKVKNAIERELKEITPVAKVKMSTSNAGEGVTEAENGKIKYISVDMGTRYVSSTEQTDKILMDSFKIMEKYNKKYKFEYQVDKKKYKSDGTNFKNSFKSVYELF